MVCHYMCFAIALVSSNLFGTPYICLLFLSHDYFFFSPSPLTYSVHNQSIWYMHAGYVCFFFAVIMLSVSSDQFDQFTHIFLGMLH